MDTIALSGKIAINRLEDAALSLIKRIGASSHRQDRVVFARKGPNETPTAPPGVGSGLSCGIASPIPPLSQWLCYDLWDGETSAGILQRNVARFARRPDIPLCDRRLWFRRHLCSK